MKNAQLAGYALLESQRHPLEYEAWKPRREEFQLSKVRRKLQSLQGDLVDASTDPQVDSKSLVNCFEHIASLLYSSGAAFGIWGSWAALTAIASLRLQDLRKALPYAILVGSQELESLAKKSFSKTLQPVTKALEVLIGSSQYQDHFLPISPNFELGESTIEYDLREPLLIQGIWSKNDAWVCFALNWYEEEASDRFDWMESDPDHFPEFDPDLCAIARIALRSGMQLQGLNPRTVEYLRPAVEASQEEIDWTGLDIGKFLDLS